MVYESPGFVLCQEKAAAYSLGECIHPLSGLACALFCIFWETWQQIEEKYYSPAPLDYRAMTYGAIRGLLASLGDPYLVFVEPSEHQLQTHSFEGSFGGISAMITVKES